MKISSLSVAATIIFSSTENFRSNIICLVRGPDTTIPVFLEVNYFWI